jgi:hypothetical protein
MSDKPIDIDTMSDEDFMKLDPSQMQEFSGSEEDPNEATGTPPEDNDQSDEDPAGNDDSEEGDSTGSEASDTGSDEDDSEDNPAPNQGDEGADEDPEKGEAPETPEGTDEKPTESDADEEPKAKDKKADAGDVESKTDTKAAVDFFEKVSAPFKADGRDMQVRTPEDVIRLMQMGVNYSRRMQEMKPLRAQDQMLKSNGLNDPEKLNFLIDLSKGNKEAIKKLLKDHQIDPVDIDTSSEDTPYQANNYQGDPKDLAFDDAIKETLAQEGGRDLIADINKDWDNTSKEALRDQPTIFQNILAQKRSGVYSKIKTELEYQRTMGFLTDVPFLQAYHQVGEAMQNAGVFGSPEPQVQPKAKTPLGTGTRKAAPKPKTEQPTPNVSSATPPRSAPANAGGHHDEPDYSSMSDEDFLKMAPPS